MQSNNKNTLSHRLFPCKFFISQKVKGWNFTLLWRILDELPPSRNFSQSSSFNQFPLLLDIWREKFTRRSTSNLHISDNSTFCFRIFRGNPSDWGKVHPSAERVTDVLLLLAGNDWRNLHLSPRISTSVIFQTNIIYMQIGSVHEYKLHSECRRVAGHDDWWTSWRARSERSSDFEGRKRRYVRVHEADTLGALFLHFAPEILSHFPSVCQGDFHQIL